MRRASMLAAILAMAAMTGRAQSSQVTQVDHEKVAAALAKGGALVTANARLGLPHARNAIIAMQVVCVAGALIPMIGFFGTWDIGAYITLVMIVVYAVHVAAVELVVRGPRDDSGLTS